MSKYDNKGCRSCRHYDVEKVKNKAGAVLSSRSARCLWKPDSPFVVPDSVGWRDGATLIDRVNAGTAGRHMEPNEGKDCPTYERRA